MDGGFGTGLLSSLISSIITDENNDNEKIIEGKINDAYDEAKKIFNEKYKTRFGDIEDSFLERQSNIDAVVKSMYFNSDKISYNDIDTRGFREYSQPEKKAIVEFLEILHEEMNKDYELNKILTEKKHYFESEKNQEEIKKLASSNNKFLNYFKDFIDKELKNYFFDLKDNIVGDLSFNKESLKRGVSDPPGLVNNLSYRNKNVESLLIQFQNKTLLHIYGGLGTGKSQLMILMSHQMTSKRIWIDCKDQSDQKLIENINSVLILHSNTKIKRNKSIVELSIPKLEENSLLILDNLPVHLLKDEVNDYIIELIKKCHKYKVKIISTSSNNFNIKLTQRLDSDLYATIPVPDTSQEETIELLKIYEAPEKFIDELAVWISYLSKKNISLTKIIIEYLKIEEWTVSKQVIENLENLDFSTDLKSHVFQTLNEKINDSETRQLLYRLTIIDFFFDYRYIQKVSEINPQIIHPMEKVISLIGEWITKKENNYLVSPLLLNAGEENLEKEVKRKTHHTIAMLIIDEENLGIYKIFQVFNHLTKAESYAELAKVYLKMLTDFEDQDVKEDYWQLTSFWKDTGLPKEMDVNLKVMIRTKQVLVRKELNEDLSFFLNDLDNLIIYADFKDENIKNFIYLILGTNYMSIDFNKSLNYIEKAINELDNIVYEEVDPELSIEDIIWILPYYMENIDDLNQWIKMVKSFSKAKLFSSVNKKHIQENMFFMTNSIWLNENKKEISHQNWKKVYDSFINLEELAVEYEIPYLKTYVLNSKIIILSEYMDDIDKALEIFKDNYDETKLESDEKFILNSIIGANLLYKNRLVEAKHYLENAEAMQSNIFLYENKKNKLNLAICNSKLNQHENSDLLRQALEIEIEKEEGNHVFEASFLGEYAISLWDEDKKVEAFKKLEELVLILLDMDEYTDDWKCIYAVTGHVLGYYSSVAFKKEPPMNINENGKQTEEYSKPKIGNFQAYNPNLVQEFDLRMLEQLKFLLFLYAKGVDEAKKAKYWILKGYEDSKESDLKNGITIMHYHYLIPYLVTEEKWEDVVAVSFKLSELLISQKDTFKESSINILDDIDLSNIFNSNKNLQIEAKYMGINRLIAIVIPYLCDRKIFHIKDTRLNIEKIKSIIQKYLMSDEFLDIKNKIFLLLDLIVECKLDLQSILQRINSLPEKLKVVFKSISYLIVSAHSNHKYALELQIKSLVSLKEIYKEYYFNENYIIKSFFKNFWIQKFVKERNQFVNCEDVDNKLRNILYRDDERLLEEVLYLFYKASDLKIEEEIILSVFNKK